MCTAARIEGHHTQFGAEIGKMSPQFPAIPRRREWFDRQQIETVYRDAVSKDVLFVAPIRWDCSRVLNGFLPAISMKSNASVRL